MKEVLVPGHVLIAEPYLGDPSFERAVVLLCEHDLKGSFGLILNHVTNNSLSDIFDDLIFDYPLFIGGPVQQNTLHFIHRIPNIDGSILLTNGIYWSGDFELLRLKMRQGMVPQSDIRFFLGYSGWGEGQLLGEINQKSWIPSEINDSILFDSKADSFWRSILIRMGGSYKVLANTPLDPRLN